MVSYSSYSLLVTRAYPLALGCDYGFVAHYSIPCIIIVPPSSLLAMCHVIDSCLLVTWFFIALGARWPKVKGSFHSSYKKVYA